MKKKVKEWIKRYLPAEIAWTITTLVSAVIALRITWDPIISAFAWSVWENVWYYWFVLIREHLQDVKHSKKKEEKHWLKGFMKTIKNLLIEFGIGEFFDSLFVRPFCLYVFPILVGEFSLGIIIWKVVADIVFYIPSIISYELRKKYLKKKSK